MQKNIRREAAAPETGGVETLTLVSHLCARHYARCLTAFEKLLSPPFREKIKTQRGSLAGQSHTATTEK